MKLELLGCDSKTNATWKVIFSEPTTVKDFIFDVLDNGGDWSHVVIVNDNTGLMYPVLDRRD